MNPKDLMIRCLVLKEGHGWVAICLPFDLAASGETLEEAKQKLNAQIIDYLRDALVGQDREHAGYLLNRSAPLKYWALYAFASTLRKLNSFFLTRKLGSEKFRRYKTPVPMEPSHAC